MTVSLTILITALSIGVMPAVARTLGNSIDVVILSVVMSFGLVIPWHHTLTRQRGRLTTRSLQPESRPVRGAFARSLVTIPITAISQVRSRIDRYAEGDIEVYEARLSSGSEAHLNSLLGWRAGKELDEFLGRLPPGVLRRGQLPPPRGGMTSAALQGLSAVWVVASLLLFEWFLLADLDFTFVLGGSLSFGAVLAIGGIGFHFLLK